MGGVIIVAPPPDILDVREQVIEGEGVARTLVRLYVLLEPFRGVAEKYPWKFTKTSQSLTASTSASGAFPGSL
jgi:hypothetical protein